MAMGITKNNKIIVKIIQHNSNANRMTNCCDTHYDQGKQHTSGHYQQLLSDANITVSMRRVKAIAGIML
jgi:hypothetical protein